MEPMAQTLGLEYVPWDTAHRSELTDKDVVAALTTNDLVKAFELVGKMKQSTMEERTRMLIMKLKDWKPEVLMGGLVNHLFLEGLANVMGCACVFLGLQTVVPSNYIGAGGVFPYFPPWTRLNRFFWKLLGKLAIYDRLTKERAPVLQDISGFKLNEFWPSYYDFISLYLAPPYPIWMACSKVMSSPLPADFTPQHRVIGSFVLSKDLEKGEDFGTESLAQMKSFLASGEPPVYMGYGSMTCHSSTWMTLISLRALKITGERGIICGGWAGLSPEHIVGESDEEDLRSYIEQKVLFMPASPNEQLFPQCKVIVQHGGAGTFGAALRSGTPTVVCPILFDQFNHARFLNERNLGVGLTAMKDAKPSELADAIKLCATSDELRRNARELAQLMNKEDGSAQFVKELTAYYHDEVTTGKHAAMRKERQNRSVKTSKTVLCFMAWCCM
eukprot:gnl/TRDRNA2_/TRDRNA2_30188_c0_seq1.p1 gnl/TRDRNA2_/TRDRNA2_30188_c0~~gnl/TRDRNA2_/TRDRNA2_30188_c0_seq1.p1  ORF type:complete len:503 (+),score=71.79 gnl/TRDRNA2_/TRDRNA2_30188_c0_seq1:178-1509(+)